MDQKFSAVQQIVSNKQRLKISHTNWLSVLLKTIIAFLFFVGWIVIAFSSTAIPFLPTFATGVVCFILTLLRILSSSGDNDFNINY